MVDGFDGLPFASSPACSIESRFETAPRQVGNMSPRTFAPVLAQHSNLNRCQRPYGRQTGSWESDPGCGRYTALASPWTESADPDACKGKLTPHTGSLSELLRATPAGLYL